MKFSICIPQYNRIVYLKRSLEMLEHQSYPELEVVVSDDCSTDDTATCILDIQKVYKHKLIYHRFESNQGYDRNFRKSIELASGQYVIVIGNDDTINPDYPLQELAKFLHKNEYPDLGFANYIEEENGCLLVERASSTGVLGSGFDIAMRYYSRFSFVGGLIWKKESFDRFNTDSQDGSIYSQIYLGVLMIARGCRLFSIKEPLVIKDLVVEKSIVRNSYRQVIARTWSAYKVENGGLPSVIHVLIEAFREAGGLTQDRTYAIFKRIYAVTFPYWLLDYRTHGAFPAAIGLAQGMSPGRNKDTCLLNGFNNLKIWVWYGLASLAGLLTPLFIFVRLRNWLYKLVKR